MGACSQLFYIPTINQQRAGSQMPCTGAGLGPDAAGQPIGKPDKDASDDDEEDDGRLRTAFIGSRSKATAPGRGVFGGLSTAEPEVSCHKPHALEHLRTDLFSCAQPSSAAAAKRLLLKGACLVA